MLPGKQGDSIRKRFENHWFIGWRTKKPPASKKGRLLTSKMSSTGCIVRSLYLSDPWKPIAFFKNLWSVLLWYCAQEVDANIAMQYSLQQRTEVVEAFVRICSITETRESLTDQFSHTANIQKLVEKVVHSESVINGAKKKRRPHIRTAAFVEDIRTRIQRSLLKIHEKTNASARCWKMDMPTPTGTNAHERPTV